MKHVKNIMYITCVLDSTRLCFCLLFSLNCDEFFSVCIFNDFSFFFNSMIRLRQVEAKLSWCHFFLIVFHFFFRQELPYHDTKKQAQVKMCTYFLSWSSILWLNLATLFFCWHLIFALESTKWNVKLAIFLRPTPTGW